MNGKDLTQGSILGNIMKFSLPYMLAYFLQILYGLVDLFVIGRYCGVASTTAVSNGAQVMYMETVVLIGLAMGTTVLTARAVGAKDSVQARVVVGNTVTMFAVIAAVLVVVLLCLRGWIVSVMDTPAEAVEGMKHYLAICFAGIHFCFSGFFTACGYAVISFLHNSISIVCARVPLAWLSSRLYPDTLFSVFRASRLLQYGVPAVGVRLVAELYRPQLII